MKVSLQTWHEQTRIWIEFARAQSAADAAHPRGGECAWSDRAMGSDEPTVATGTFEGAGVTVDVFGDGRLDRFRYGGPDIESFERLKRLLDRILQSQSFEIYVHAVGSGSDRHLEITRVRD